jgi:uncharacterized BrkB/YihY/UPF0761 family membrane protein
MRRFGQRAFEFYWGDGIADDVPALTYFLVLSLGPFALGLAALQALLLDSVLTAIEVADQINRFLPGALHNDVTRLVLGTRDDSPLLLALAVASMLWTTSGAIGVVERCESRILGCPRHDIVTGRLRNLALVALASAGAPVIGDVADWANLRGSIPNWLLLALNTAGSIAVFAAVYRLAPRSALRWRSAVVGAVPAGIAIQTIPALVGVYVGAAAGFAAVRLFLVLAVVLLGLYVMATVILVGSGLAVRRELRHRRLLAASATARVERFEREPLPGERAGAPTA